MATIFIYKIYYAYNALDTQMCIYRRVCTVYFRVCLYESSIRAKYSDVDVLYIYISCLFTYCV